MILCSFWLTGSSNLPDNSENLSLFSAVFFPADGVAAYGGLEGFVSDR